MNRLGESWPRAILGDPLEGRSPVRFIYVDEAGTSANEPVTVVAAVILHADRHWMVAEQRVRDVIDHFVPDHFKPGFIFHAKEIWGSPKYRENWEMARRVALLQNMMWVPRRLGLALSFAIVRRGEIPMPDELRGTYSQAQFDHLLAFRHCMGRVDKYIRDHADPEEVGAVICEDVPELKPVLRKMLHSLRTNPTLMRRSEVQPTKRELATGQMTQDTEEKVTRIADSIHFVDKTDGPLLQIADACAFGLRRYFSEQQMGKEFIDPILGREPDLEDYSTPSSAATYYFHPRRKPPTAQFEPEAEGPNP